MASNKEALALELRQIIQADRMACDVIDEATGIGQSIERDAEKRKAQILAEAERARAEMEKQVRAEQEQALKDRIAQVEEQYAGRQKAMEEKMERNRDGWVDAIVGRITS